VFTRKRWSPPGLTGDWVVDGPKLLKAMSDYWLALESKGALTIGEASITANQGIAFPATQVASSDANTLDDYEESLTSGWTPTDGSGAALAFSAANGTYIKVGALVIAWGNVTYPATADASAAKISGLPFTVRNVSSIGGGGMIGTATETTLSRVQPIINTANINLLKNDGNSVTNATMSGDGVAFCLIYAV
jgi:hypothetical protein